MKQRWLIIAFLALVMVGSGVLLTDTGWGWAKAIKYFVLSGDQKWDKNITERDGVHTMSLVAPIFTIEDYYIPMLGPQSTHHFRISEKKELVWFTGYRVDVVDEVGEPIAEDYLCHNNFEYAVDAYLRNWYLPDRVGTLTSRLFEMTPGQTKLEFPKGYGVPMMTNENMSITTQALNLNDDTTFTLRHRAQLDYVYNKGANRAMKPLFQQGVSVMPLVAKKYLEENNLDPLPGCVPALPSLDYLMTNDEGYTFTGHWMVEPGDTIYSSNITRMLNLPFSTTLHYAAAHLHPFAEYLELYDLTDSSTVFISNTKNYDQGRVGLLEIPVFSSEEGVMLYKNHEYELRTRVNNTTEDLQDAMAVMLLYMYDKELDDRISKYYASR